MLKTYTIMDNESKTYSQMPMFFTTNRDAIEAFRELANDEKTSIAKFPKDFQLLQIGEYDPRGGIITSAEHVPVVWANELLEQ